MAEIGNVTVRVDAVITDEQYREAMGAVRAANERIDLLEHENDNLRGLVRDMWNGMCGYRHDCRSCEHYELYAEQRFAGECEYHRRMRELGIEVE